MEQKSTATISGVFGYCYVLCVSCYVFHVMCLSVYHSCSQNSLAFSFALLRISLRSLRSSPCFSGSRCARLAFGSVLSYTRGSMKQKDQTFFFVDGTNSYAGQFALFGPADYLDFKEVVRNVEKHVGYPIDKTLFYASYTPKPKRATSKQLAYLKNEGLFFRSVRRLRSVYFYKGHRSPTSGKEKGVDIHLGIDIVKAAFLGECHRIIIMTGDTDLLYAIETAKSKHLPIHGVFLPNRFSLDIAYNVYSGLVLNYKSTFKKNRYNRLPKKLEIVAL